LSQATADYRAKQHCGFIKAADRDRPRPHRRQFTIGPRPIDRCHGWVSLHLSGDNCLSHCPDLRVSQATDARGNRWHLLGLAVQTVADRPDPVEDIANATAETIEETYYSWAGRWLLVGCGRLYMDCSGLLGCFYGNRKVSAGEEFWVSNSAAVLAEVLDVDTRLSYRIEHGFGIDWYIPPRSGVDSIRRLLPSQVLDLSNGTVRSRRLIPPLPQKLNYEEALDELQTYFITVLRRVSEISERLWLALTGGKDSRTFLAVAKFADIPVRPYTHCHAHITHADRTLPPRLAKTVGMEHTLVTGGEYSAVLEQIFDRHTAGHSVDRDRFYFSHDYFKWCRKGDMILRSHCIEIGRWARGRFPIEEFGPSMPEAGEMISRYKERGFKYAKRDPSGSFPPPMYEALDEWVAWSRSWPQEEVDWRDRLWIEQCLAGWLSSIEQSLDLIDAERFYPLNSQRFFALVLQVPEEKCQPKLPTYLCDLIGRMAPELLRFPFNPPDPVSVHSRLLSKLMSLLRKVCR